MSEWCVIRGPVELESGTVGRVVELPDGGMRLETWSRSKGAWVVGGARFSDTFFASPLSPERAKELGISSEIARTVMAPDETEAIVQARIEAGSSSPDWRVVKGPVTVEGGVVAQLLRSDGGRGAGRVETWSPDKGWVEGGASAGEVLFDGSPLSPSRTKKLGIPDGTQNAETPDDTAERRLDLNATSSGVLETDLTRTAGVAASEPQASSTLPPNHRELQCADEPGQLLPNESWAERRFEKFVLGPVSVVMVIVAIIAAVRADWWTAAILMIASFLCALIGQGLRKNVNRSFRD